MNANDDELQNRIAQHGDLQDDRADSRAYREVFRAISKDPGYRLKDGFAARVVAAAAARQHRREVQDYLWFVAGIAFLTISFVITVFYTGFKVNWGFLSGMSDYKGLLVFGMSFILLLHCLDKQIVRGKQAQQ